MLYRDGKLIHPFIFTKKIVPSFFAYETDRKFENPDTFSTNKIVQSAYNLDYGIPEGSPGADTTEYYLNNYGLRCDDFSYSRSKRHALFAGCSNTFATGVPVEFGWAKKVYDKLNHNDDYAGFYNVAIPGSSISEICYQVYRYLLEFGNPEVIFILFPEIDRDLRYTKNSEYAKIMALNAYLMLHTYCKSHNIKLVATTWAIELKKEVPIENDDSFRTRIGKELGRRVHDNWVKDSDLFTSNFSDTFFQLDSKKYTIDCYEYSLNNRDLPFIIEGLDGGWHPGAATHHAWSEQMYNKYMEQSND
jgi:hypothetical protein